MPQRVFQCGACGKTCRRHHNARKCGCGGRLELVITPCGCVAMVRNKLAIEGDNTELDTCFQQVGKQVIERFLIGVKKRNPRLKRLPRQLVTTYCPVCGQRQLP